MNAQQLKNSILQEAIMGKLVPQDPNDEPASVLLDKIREEKKRLVKEGKLKKKDLEETPISEDERPFEIPESWEWVRWGALSESIQYGYNAPAKEKGRIKMVRISDIQNGKIVWDTTPYCDIEEQNIDDYKLTKNDILFARTGGTVGKSYLVSEEPQEAIYAGYLIRTRYSSQLCPQYLKMFMDSSLYWEQLKDGTIATAQPNCNGQKLAKMILPLPPLAEQKRIVSKIEELLPKIDEYGKAQEALDKLNEELPEKLKKSILQEAIMGKLVPQDPNDEPASVLLDKIREEKKRLVKEGKLKKKDLEETPISEDERPFEIPESWEWVRIKDIFVINPKVIADDDADAAFIPMEKIEACYGSKFSYEIRKWKTIKSSFTCFADGDVAFAKITPCFQNRKSMILKNLPNGIGAGTTELKVLRQYAETIERKYLLYFLASSYFIDEATFKGTANQQRIIVGYLENKIFPLPPLSEQMRIVAKIEELMHEIDKLKV